MASIACMGNATSGQETLKVDPGRRESRQIGAEEAIGDARCWGRRVSDCFFFFWGVESQVAAWKSQPTFTYGQTFVPMLSVDEASHIQFTSKTKFPPMP